MQDNAVNRAKLAKRTAHAMRLRTKWTFHRIVFAREMAVMRAILGHAITPHPILKPLSTAETIRLRGA